MIEALDCLLLQSRIIDIVFEAKKGPTELVKALHSICQQAEQAAKDDYTLLVLSDRVAGAEFSPVR